MFMFEDEANNVEDREDLIAILKMRFGEIPPKVIETIYDIKDYNTLERLILVASNVPSLKIFLEEMEAGSGSFKILGERFNPIEATQDGEANEKE
ncbi:hypothetical protein FH966_12860 [Lentibacillus cibarius]|uniref:Uncharacterized protein n=1 Tax=Lentibacillus cibarius TaxID=2583219 RepID=A0A549YKW0_9BACI|nr:hypothetical protein [Lentibacillus cibarius]TMN23683.1 hypothetical protein FFL34_17430 [Lentibacillus cibarius]TRM12515.1 hypothetical protein FH966_12860 [Lentibacillus cibarius]